MSRGLVRALPVGSLTLLLALAAAVDARADIPQSEYDALMAIYNATGGPSWGSSAGWGGTLDTVCTFGGNGWYGVVCNGTQTNVQGLFLSANNLAGTLPPDVGLFPALQNLEVASNSLDGAFPPEIGQLTALRELKAEGNSFDGTIPDIFAGMQFLQILYLCCNQFGGQIPPSIAAATALQELFLTDNDLQGAFPPSFQNLVNMRVLIASGNSFNGNIPGPLFANMTALQTLDLAYNFFDGGIPSELTTLPVLQNLVLSGNLLSGPIPPGLGSVLTLRNLQLQDNGSLNGPIPTTLGNLASLQSLYLQGNSLSGAIPPALGQLTSLRYLDLSNNALTGTIPDELGNLPVLLELNLSTNPGLAGATIPASLGNLPLVATISLTGCLLQGGIPAELGQLGTLESLQLNDNQLSGPLPPEIGNLGALRYLALAGNNLSGTLPTEIGQLGALEELAIGRNSFTGTFPSSMVNLVNLTLLSTNSNQFNGSIPTLLGQLSNLRVLDLRDNRFTGPIDQFPWPNLQNLRDLELAENNFNGSIPTLLGQLSSLNELELERNSFNGSIPTLLGQLSNLTRLNLYGNAIGGDVPASLANLPLAIDGLDLSYNLLYTNDAALRAFLNSRQIGGDFEATQTVAPASLGTTGSGATTVDLTWSPIRYASDPGSFLIFYGTSPGSHPTAGPQTIDKTDTSEQVGGLESARTYYMVVHTETRTHQNNSNIIVSDHSPEVVVRTSGCFGLAPATLPSGFVGDAFNQALTPTGGTAPFTWEVDDGTLPTGVTLSATGVLSGTLGAAGTFAFTIRAEDATGCGGAQSYTVTVTADVNHVVGQGLGSPNPNQVKVYDEAGIATSVDFLAYGAGRWGVNVATGELNGGNDEIVTGPGPGDVFGPQVRGFVRDGTAMPKVNFFAYGTLKFGVNVGAGGIETDVYEEIVSGAGSGAVFGPHVRGWNVDAATASPIAKVNFFAYGTLKFGVNVATGRIDGDAFAEILTAPGPGLPFGPQVRGFNYDGAAISNMAKVNFLVATTTEYGASHASADVDDDGFDEIVGAPGPGPGVGFESTFRGYDFDGTAIVAAPGYVVTAYTTTYGGRPGLGDVDRDGSAELMAGAGRDPVADSTVTRYAYDGTALTPLPPTFLPFGTARFGVNVAGGGLGY